MEQSTCKENVAESTVGMDVDVDMQPTEKIEYLVFEEDGDDGCGNPTMRLYQYRRPTLEEAVQALDSDPNCVGIVMCVNDEPLPYDVMEVEITLIRRKLAAAKH